MTAASTASYAQRSDSFRCDECGAEMALPLFCDHCGGDYPERRAMSPFAILGLATTFALSAEQIEERELLLTRRLHPDRWQQSEPRLHKKALLAQAAVNESLEAIREPIDRGDTLLALLAAPLLEEVGAQQRANQGFLIEQLELQEEARGDLDPARRRALKTQVRAELATLNERLADSFSALEQSPGDDSSRSVVAEALRWLGEARYWRNLQRTLRGEAPR